MKTLETERLILRAWRLEDAADVFAYASGSRVGPMAGWKPHETLAETKELLRNFIEQDDTWAVTCFQRITGDVESCRRPCPP